MIDVDAAAERLRAVFRLLARRADAISGADAPTRSEQQVLAWLAEKETMTPGELSTAQGVRPQTVGQTLDSLDRRDWIARRPDASDRRKTLISLTPSGRAALLKGRALRQAWLVGELNKLGPEDGQTLVAAIDILERMVQP